MALEKIRPYQLSTAAETLDDAWMLIDDEDAVYKTTVRAVKLPTSMTKAERNALPTVVAGTIIYQTDNTPGLRAYINGAWVMISTEADP